MYECKQDLAGKQVFYRDTETSGDPIVFLHGNSSSTRIFVNQFRAPIFANHRLIAPDLPGHGESGWIESSGEHYSVKYYADFLEGFLETLELDRYILVGISLGGHVAIEFANRTDKILGLHLTGTPPVSTVDEFDSAFLPSPEIGLLFQGKLKQADVLALAKLLSDRSTDYGSLAKDIQSSDDNTRAQLGESIGNGEIGDQLQVLNDINRPVSFVVGSNDRIVNRDFLFKKSSNCLSRHSIHVIKDSGHIANFDNHAEFNALLRAFCDQIFG